MGAVFSNCRTAPGTSPGSAPSWEEAGTGSGPGTVELERDISAGGSRALRARVRVRPLKPNASGPKPCFLFMVEEAALDATVPGPREATRDRDELIARAAHELRGPFGSIANWAHLLSQGAPDGALQQQGLAAIHRALKAGTQIIDELYDLALLRAGKLRLRAGLVDLVPIVDMALERPRSAAQEKGVQLEVVRDVPSVAVMGDPDRLQQILLHLLTNAIKHTPAGGRIEIALGRDETSWRLTVSDTGRGIARYALPRIFDGNHPVSPGTARSPGSLGVGLAIVRQLAELHGGSVEASSPGPGLGARFVVRLPVPALAPSGAFSRQRRSRRRRGTFGCFEPTRPQGPSVQANGASPPGRVAVQVVFASSRRRHSSPNPFEGASRVPGARASWHLRCKPRLA